MSSTARRLVQFALALAICAITLPAWAWVDVHTVSHESRVQVGRQGMTEVFLTTRIKIAGGPLRAFDLKIADHNVTIHDDSTLSQASDESGVRATVPTVVEQRADGELRVDIDGKHGIGHGIYDLRIHYTVDLLKQGAVSRDGAMFRVEWTGVRFEDGLDNVKCTFAMVSSPNEPRGAGESLKTDGIDTSIGESGAFLTSLERTPLLDQLTLVRPHVAKNEAVNWGVRIDPAAIGEQLPAQPPVSALSPPSEKVDAIPPDWRAAAIAIAAFVAVIYSIMFGVKHGQLSRLARSRQAQLRPLVAIPSAIKILLAGPALAASVGAQLLLPNALWGSLGVVGVCILVAYRSCPSALCVRGPGRWLYVTDSDVAGLAGREPNLLIDCSSPAGCWLFGFMFAAHVVLSVALARVAPDYVFLIAADFVAFAALFCTGLQTWVAPGVAVSARWFGRLAASLRKQAVRVSPMVRVPCTCKRPDELRLSVRTPAPPKGLLGFEIALGWLHTSSVPVPAAQLLLRVVEGSACHKHLAAHVGKAHWVRGRDSHEKVLMISPALPTRSCTAALVRRVIQIIGASETKPSRKSVPARQAGVSSLRPQRQSEPAVTAARQWGELLTHTPAPGSV